MPLIDNNVTRFPNGITTVDAGNIFNSMKVPDVTAYHTFFEDFDFYVAANWTVTETQAGATQALADGDGGLLLLTNSAADNDINQIQKSGASYVMAAGKKLFLKARFKLSDATDSDFAIGLQNTNVDGTALATATDGVFFLKADDAATLAVYIRQDNSTGSASATGISTLVNDTFVTVSAFYDGGDRLYYGVNDTVLGFLTVTSSILPNTNLAPIASLKNGAAAAKTATVDYIFVAEER